MIGSYMVNVNDTETESNNTEHCFKPFTPKLDNIKPMEIIMNLPIVQDIEFDLEYISTHGEQYALEPNLCNKCCPLLRHFQLREPHVQDLYKNNCCFQFLENAAQMYDIKLYVNLKTPVFQLENILVCHPPERPRGVIILTHKNAQIKGKT